MRGMKLNDNFKKTNQINRIISTLLRPMEIAKLILRIFFSYQQIIIPTIIIIC